MNGELALYAEEIQRLLDWLCRTVEGLDEPTLNAAPTMSGTNSTYVIAVHTLGNLEAWVLGIIAGQPIERDRPGEFVSSGPSAGPIIERARDLGRKFHETLRALSLDRLDEVTLPEKQLWGEGDPRPTSGREALMHTIEHAAMHLGHIHVTLDTIRAGAR